MKIYIAGYDPTRIGGGWGFSRVFHRAMGDALSSFDEADIYFIPGASMTNREEVISAKKAGKKIVLRVDNALLPSNNRGGGMTHLQDYSNVADLIIFQSKWARDYLKPFLGKTGPIILNAVDRNLFHSQGRKYRDKREGLIYGYVRSSRHETKMWEAARYYYSRIFQQQPNAHLFIVGKFSGETQEYNFNFYAGERYTFLGEQPPEKMPEFYRRVDVMLVPFFNDACSNTLIEALCCGCSLYENPFLKTGGTPEILAYYAEYGPEYFGIDRLRDQYREVFSVLLS